MSATSIPGGFATELDRLLYAAKRMVEEHTTTYYTNGALVAGLAGQATELRTALGNLLDAFVECTDTDSYTRWMMRPEMDAAARLLGVDEPEATWGADNGVVDAGYGRDDEDPADGRSAQ